MSGLVSEGGAAGSQPVRAGGKGVGDDGESARRAGPRGRDPKHRPPGRRPGTSAGEGLAAWARRLELLAAFPAFVGAHGVARAAEFLGVDERQVKRWKATALDTLARFTFPMTTGNGAWFSPEGRCEPFTDDRVRALLARWVEEYRSNADFLEPPPIAKLLGRAVQAAAKKAGL